jgi:proline dehydrogenase
MLDAFSRMAFSALASSTLLKRLASNYGMRRDQSFARRFIAGETIDEVIEVARAIERTGLTVTVDYLGERAVSTASAADATRAYVAIIGDFERAGVGRNLSVKLTQLGIEVDRATSIDNLRRIVDAAAKAEFFVRIDMEGSAYTEQTLDAFETLWSIGYRNAGVVLQSYLRRSPGDAQRMNELGARVRLVKGAYNEPSAVAFRHKHEVDAAFIELMKVLLQHGTYPAIATHDPAMIAATTEFAASEGLGTDRFEFQMLYGIRRDLQARLHAEGHGLRIYVPFGREWFPYFMRRLGERPANVGFVVGSVLKERR